MLASCATLRRMARGEVLFDEKEEVRTLYLMADGLAALCKTSESGERRVLFLYGAGKTLNEAVISDPAASARCEVLQDAVLLCILVHCVLGAMEQDFQFAKAMMASMAYKIRRLYHQMKNTACSLRGDKRIAAKLWKLSRDFGKPADGKTEIDFDLTITFLADMLGSKRETVSRQVKLLEQAGLVEFRDGRFYVADRDALKNIFSSRDKYHGGKMPKSLYFC